MPHEERYCSRSSSRRVSRRAAACLCCCQPRVAVRPSLTDTAVSKQHGCITEKDAPRYCLKYALARSAVKTLWALSQSHELFRKSPRLRKRTRAVLQSRMCFVGRGRAMTRSAQYALCICLACSTVFACSAATLADRLWNVVTSPYRLDAPQHDTQRHD
jgi:hypothetical protein